MIFDILHPLSPMDFAALLWMLVWWSGYTLITEGVGRRYRPARRVLSAYRDEWMERMLMRDNRIGDVNIIISYHHGGEWFASTTMLIIAGIVAMLGNASDVQELLGHISFAAIASQQLLELKILTLLLVFVYAFFKFAWCLRQYNAVLIIIGATPMPEEGHTGSSYARSSASLLARATSTFQRGMRAYYYGLATLTWFVHPVAFMAAIILVTLVQYRRDYRSVMVKILQKNDPSAGRS